MSVSERKILLLSKALGESELRLIEDALKNFDPAYLENNPHGQQLLEQLKETVTMARAWSHQFGRTERI